MSIFKTELYHDIYDRVWLPCDRQRRAAKKNSWPHIDLSSKKKVTRSIPWSKNLAPVLLVGAKPSGIRGKGKEELAWKNANSD